MSALLVHVVWLVGESVPLSAGWLLDVLRSDHMRVLLPLLCIHLRCADKHTTVESYSATPIMIVYR